MVYPCKETTRRHYCTCNGVEHPLIVVGDSVLMHEKQFSEREIALLKETRQDSQESTYDILLRLTERTLNCEYEMGVDGDYKGQMLRGQKAGLGKYEYKRRAWISTYEAGVEHGFEVYKLRGFHQTQAEMRNGQKSGLGTNWLNVKRSHDYFTNYVY